MNQIGVSELDALKNHIVYLVKISYLTGLRDKESNYESNGADTIEKIAREYVSDLVNMVNKGGKDE